MAEYRFLRRKIITDKLLSFGFTETNGLLEYETAIAENQFELKITVLNENTVNTRVTDLSSGDEFVLHLVPDATGSFIGGIKAEYERILQSIQDSCTEADVFKSRQANELIQYVRNTFTDELEYLWQKFPDNAVWRRKDNQKWYAAVLTVSRRKLGLNSDEIVEIIDLRADKEEITDIVDNIRFFPGWHMNKKSWYTIILDDSVSTNEIIGRLNTSYNLAK